MMVKQQDLMTLATSAPSSDHPGISLHFPPFGVLMPKGEKVSGHLHSCFACVFICFFGFAFGLVEVELYLLMIVDLVIFIVCDVKLLYETMDFGIRVYLWLRLYGFVH